jgi:plastocyanin
MRQHKNDAIKVIATAMALITVAACGSSGSGGSSNGGGPVPGASTTITAVGSQASGGGGGSPYSTGPVMAAGRMTSRANPYFFTPTPDTITAGATMTFVFQDVNHTVTFDTPGSPANISSAAAGGVANADSMRVFPTAGTYNYHCSIHPYMTGTVIVQ